LDSTFGDPSSSSGSIGMTAFNLLGGNNGLWGVAVQLDGRIVVSGPAYDGTQYQISAVRLTDTGILDTTFGVGGIVIPALGGNSPSFPHATLQPADGNIVVTGSVGFASGSDAGYNFATIRLRP
jgi:hypothetical protein